MNKVLLIERTDHGPCVAQMYISPREIDRTVPRLSTCDTLTRTRYLCPLSFIALPCTALSCPIIHIYLVLVVILVGYLLTVISNAILWFRLQTLCPCQI